MIEVRRAADRGHIDHGWLDTYHSFSFAEYHDPAHTHFGALRVINEDRVAPGQGFGMHGHRDMEIVTYVLEGSLAHRDSMGNGSTISAGMVQRMSAGSGVMHSEFNASPSAWVHLLQIWIFPKARDLEPSYEERTIDRRALRGRFAPIATPQGRDGSVVIHQDAEIHAALLDGAEQASYIPAAGRRLYLHVARGHVQASGHALGPGDALKVRDPAGVTLEQAKAAEVLLFDLA